MNITIGMGAVGKNDTSWGATPDGLPVLLIRTPEATLRIVFTPAEAKDLGTAAIYLAMAATVAQFERDNSGPDGGPRPASRLFGADGGPLQ